MSANPIPAELTRRADAYIALQQRGLTLEEIRWLTENDAYNLGQRDNSFETTSELMPPDEQSTLAVDAGQ